MQPSNKMKKTTLYFILAILLVNIAYAEKYFVLDVNYIIGSVTFNSINLREVDTAIRYTDSSGFLIKAVSFDNSDITKIYYNMSENKRYFIYIPYSENAARIEVYNPKNSRVMDIDVASFANTCGNKKCEGHESYESCTTDCTSGSKDDFCDEVKDGICDPDCFGKADIDCKDAESKENASIAAKPSLKEDAQEETGEPKEKTGYLIWILSVLAIIILILLFLFIRKKKQSRTMDSLKQYIGENIRKGFTLQQIKDVLYREGYTEREIDRAVKSI